MLILRSLFELRKNNKKHTFISINHLIQMDEKKSSHPFETSKKHLRRQLFKTIDHLNRGLIKQLDMNETAFQLSTIGMEVEESDPETEEGKYDIPAAIKKRKRDLKESEIEWGVIDDRLERFSKECIGHFVKKIRDPENAYLSSKYEFEDDDYLVSTKEVIDYIEKTHPELKGAFIVAEGGIMMSNEFANNIE